MNTTRNQTELRLKMKINYSALVLLWEHAREETDLLNLRPGQRTPQLKRLCRAFSTLHLRPPAKIIHC